jgi:hypothetical protein
MHEVENAVGDCFHPFTESGDLGQLGRRKRITLADDRRDDTRKISWRIAFST